MFRDDNGRLLIIGVVSWSTGPNNAEGCGGLTGVTPLSLYRGWIVGDREETRLAARAVTISTL